MSESALSALLKAAANILEPFADAATTPDKRQALLASIGWNLTATGVDLTAFDTALGDLGAVAKQLNSGTEPSSLDDVATLLHNVEDAFAKIAALPNALHGLPAPAAAALGSMALQLAQRAVFEWLGQSHPRVAAALMMLGIYQPQAGTPDAIIDSGTGAAIFTPTTTLRLDFGYLSTLLIDPVAALKDLFLGHLAGTAALDLLDAVVLPLAGGYLSSLGLPVQRTALPSDVEIALGWPEDLLTAEDRAFTIGFPIAGGLADSALTICLTVLPAAGAKPSLVLLPLGTLTFDTDLSDWHLAVSSSGAASAVVIDAAGTVSTLTDPSLTVSVAVQRAPADGDAVTLGPADETHLRVHAVGASLSFGVTDGTWDMSIGLAMSGAELLIKPSGFLAEIIPGSGIRVVLDSTLTWSRANGVRLTGPNGKGEGLVLKVPVGLALGPVHIPELDLGITPGNAGIAIDLAANVSARLGPFEAAIDRVGIRTDVRGSVAGSVAPAGLSLAPLLPTTVGLSIESDTVSGGGFLSLDPDTGSYVGAVQLHIAGVGVSAVGLLSTKLPDGSPGFSLLVVISAQFPPVQIGFGFALVGLGGLLGVNRTTDVTALQSGLQAGALDSVLFPTDIVARAQRVVSDLDRYFPIAKGQYVLGPTVQLTWGEGSLFTATLGIFLELPSPTRVIIAGQVHIAVPTPKAPVVSIELDVLGVIDFSAKQLAIDAVLRNSKVAGFNLTGQAAVRASWGGSPAFLLAAGGFNPGFTPPASFPSLQRLQLALGDGNNPRLRLSAYFALTSNTVQFGARLDLYAGIDIPVVGTFAITGMLSFDALIQFSPFAFAVEIAAGLTLSLGGNPLMGISLDLTLSGPQPWHAVGTATINFLGSHKVQFAVTSGVAPSTTPTPQIDVATTLRSVLADPANWSCAQPDGGLLVVLAGAGQPAGADPLVVHPSGELTVKQRTAPLGIEVTHTGSMRALDPGSHAITTFAVGSRTDSDAVMDWFAAAQFIDLNDAEKLSRPSFELMTAGATLSGAGVTCPAGDWTAWNQDVDVVTTILTPPRPGAAGSPQLAVARRAAAATVRLGDERVLGQLAGSAAAQLGPRSQGSSRFAAPGSGIAIRPPTYAVATRRDLSAAAASGAAGDALTYLPTFTDATQRRPNVSGLQVVETPDVFAPVVATTPASIDQYAMYSITAAHSGKCLDVGGASVADGAGVVQWDYVAAPNQQWRILPLGNGCCTVLSVNSQMHLGIAGDDLRNGAAVVQQVPSNQLGQQWRIVQVAGGWYSLQNSLTGRCLDIAGGSQSTADGAGAQQWDWYSGENQKWRLDAVPSTLLLRQQIRRIAYDDYLVRGRTAGHALDDWLRAEAAVLRPLITVRAYYLYLQRGQGWGRAVNDWLTSESLLCAEIAGGIG